MTPWYDDGRLTLFSADCVEAMSAMPEASVASIVTDPPYGISFMGQQWDQPGEFGSKRSDGQAIKRRGHRRQDGSRLEEGALAAGTYDQSAEGRERFQRWCESWAREALRVAQPGAWLLSFGSPRSHHRLAVGLEDAGWELTDEIAWLFAQGMPKGATTLKPAHEPIVLARKPARRVTPLQIDEARIPFAGRTDEAESKGKNRHADFGTEPGRNLVYNEWSVPSRNYDAEGRWPANVVMTEPLLEPGVADVVLSRAESTRGHRPSVRGPFSGDGGGMNGHSTTERVLDSGSYSRYFVIPKAGRRERNAGLEDLDEQPLLWSSGTKSPGTFQSPGTRRAARNNHPTVKPLELMEHLVRLVTPPRWHRA